MPRFTLSAILLGLAMALAPTASVRAQSPSETAEITFWNSVKDSRDAAEVRAYLERFPEGLFAPLARIRLKRLEAGEASAPTAAPASNAPPPPASPPSPPPAASPSALTSEKIIREVQDRLYNLNYQIGPRNGRVSTETQQAIRHWQKNLKLPETGDLSFVQLVMLRSARVPTNWGALAYHTKGATATVWERPTREAAEQEALAECRKHAKAPCHTLAVPDKTCGALGFYTAVVSGRQHRGTYAFVRRTLTQARADALSECRRRASRSNACTIRVTVCADGSHKR